MSHSQEYAQELCRLDLVATLEGLTRGQFSAEELVSAYLERMTSQAELNAYITLCADQAVEQARHVDSLSKTEKAQQRLAGVPLAIKDLFCTKDVRTTAGSHILENFIPAYESHVTDLLRCQGAIMLGKANLDEFAMGSANLTSYYGPAINPWKDREAPTKKLVPGGSSGGSAAAVAAGLAVAATGTDTGGSIRQPASFCGIVGMKPTYGRCSRRGIVAFASSLDQAGPMTRSVRDAALMLEVMAGFDPQDSTSAQQDIPAWSQKLTTDLKGKKIGIPKEYRLDGLDLDIETLWDQGAQWCREAGAEIVEVSLPHTQMALPTYYIVAPAEASSNLARYDGVRYGLREEAETLAEMYAKTRAKGFGEEVKRRIFIGTYVLSAGYYDAYYVQAQKVRHLIAQDFVRAFEKVDILLTPTTPSAAFAVGEEPADPVSMYFNDIFTVPASLAGLPAISVPAGLNHKGLPLGLQLIAPAFAEDKLFGCAAMLEEAAQFPGLLG